MLLNEGHPRKRVLSVFSLVMINVIAVDSLRTLPIAAEYGFALLFFYLIAGLLFFIPTALVSAELATGWPTTGGLYIWIREAFGERWGFFVIWLQWIYNVVWYPTILSFIVGTVVYFINPSLTQDKVFMFTSILTLFWTTTLINCFGMRTSSLVSTLGALFGTIFPMLFIIGLGSFWLMKGNAAQISFTAASFFPDLDNLANLAFMITILFGLLGIEMSAVHAEEVKNPGKDYPKALLISSAIILLSLMLSSLAIAIVVPHKELSLVTGLLQAFEHFFLAYNMAWMKPVIAGLIVLGAMAGVSAWVIGPTKGLWAASHDGNLPPALSKVTRRFVPIPILFLQGVIFTLLSLVFLFMPNVHSSYWILSDLTAQLALVVYVVLFAAAIRLRYKKSHQPRAFKIPGGNWGIWIVCGAGMLISITAIVIGFIPPKKIETGSVLLFESILIGGLVLLSLPPFILYRFRQPHWHPKDSSHPNHSLMK